MEVPLFSEVPKLSYNVYMKLPCQNQLDSFCRFDITPTCDRQTDSQTQSHGVYRAIIASRGASVNGKMGRAANLRE